MSVRNESSRSPALAAVLGTLALLLIGTGGYFEWLRPSLLPEDLRYLRLAENTVPIPLAQWLHLVFATLGGFILGFGILLAGVSGVAWSGRLRPLWWCIAIASPVAVGRFFYSNLVLGSYFLWFVSILALIAAAAMTLSIIRLRRGE